jgi:hypothetical protein
MILGLVMSVATPLRSQTLMSGDIVQFIKTIKDAMPDIGSNKFFIPTNAHLNYFDTLFIDLKKKNFSAISARASLYGYQFIQFVNTATNDTLYILKENIPVLRGWGTYIFDPAAANNLTIETPHPLWDTNSWEFAIKLFIKADSKWFILAGTHRYCNSDSSSDMAHVTQSVFHVAHKRSGTSKAVQIHGFSKSGSNAGYPDVVISNGTLNPPSILTTLETKYESKGFTAGVFSASTYQQLGNLGATTNKQGQWSNSNGQLFVHIEHDYPLRTTLSKQLLSIDAICETFTPPTSVEKKNTAAVTHFELLNNFPNPFNPSTTIQFYLPTNDWVRLSVYDLWGKEIDLLMNDHIERGFHSVQFNAEQYSSGIYFCNIKTTSYIRTIRMVLIK